MSSIILRLPDNLHEAARRAAAGSRRSLNNWIVIAVQGQAMREALRPGGGPIAAALDPEGRKPSRPRR
jgi:hypothetical protein